MSEERPPSKRKKKLKTTTVQYVVKETAMTGNMVMGVAMGMMMIIVLLVGATGLFVLSHAILLPFPSPVYTELVAVMIELLAICAFGAVVITVIMLQARVATKPI